MKNRDSTRGSAGMRVMHYTSRLKTIVPAEIVPRENSNEPQASVYAPNDTLEPQRRQTTKAYHRAFPMDLAPKDVSYAIHPK